VIQTFHLTYAAQNDRKIFEVLCTGQCRGAKVTLQSTTGDPDLYGLETEIPCSDVTSACTCAECNAFCESKSTSGTDVCDNLNTESSVFYIAVYAHTEYDDATITFENVQKVVEVSVNGESGKSI
jgi:hypothetical protein